MLCIRAPEFIHLRFSWNFIPSNNILPLTPASDNCPLSVSMSLTFLDSTYKWYKLYHTIFVFLYGLILLSIMSSRSIHVTKGRKNFFFSWLSNISLCIYKLHLLYLFIYSWILKLFPYLGTVNNAAIHMGVQVPFWYLIFISFG